MGVEIERKFLVRGEAWRALGDGGTALRQGYLSVDPDRTVRVRLAGTRGTLTIKGRGEGASRPEFEWPIPAPDAEELLDTLALPGGIHKVRHRVALGALVVEVDVFAGLNEGLVLAEIELPEEGFSLTLPDWLGQEVTGVARYFNSALVKHPFSRWSPQERAGAKVAGHDD